MQYGALLAFSLAAITVVRADQPEIQKAGPPQTVSRFPKVVDYTTYPTKKHTTQTNTQTTTLQQRDDDDGLDTALDEFDSPYLTSLDDVDDLARRDLEQYAIDSDTSGTHFDYESNGSKQSQSVGQHGDLLSTRSSQHYDLDTGFGRSKFDNDDGLEQFQKRRPSRKHKKGGKKVAVTPASTSTTTSTSATATKADSAVNKKAGSANSASSQSQKTASQGKALGALFKGPLMKRSNALDIGYDLSSLSSSLKQRRDAVDADYDLTSATSDLEERSNALGIDYDLASLTSGLHQRNDDDDDEDDDDLTSDILEQRSNALGIDYDLASLTSGLHQRDQAESIGTLPAFLEYRKQGNTAKAVETGLALAQQNPQSFAKAVGTDQQGLDILSSVKQLYLEQNPQHQKRWEKAFNGKGVRPHHKHKSITH